MDGQCNIQGANRDAILQHLEARDVIGHLREEDAITQEQHEAVTVAQERVERAETGLSENTNEEPLNNVVTVKQEFQDGRPTSDCPGESRDGELDRLIEVVASNVNKQERGPLLKYLGLSEKEMKDLDLKAFRSGLKHWKRTRGQAANATRLMEAVFNMRKNLKVKDEPASVLSSRSKLYVKISKSLPSDDVSRLRSMMVTQEIFGQAVVENKTAQEILNMLEADHWIGKGNMDLLVEILTCLGQTKLAKEAVAIENAENGVVKTETVEQHTMTIKQELGERFERIAEGVGKLWERLAYHLGYNTDEIQALKKEYPLDMCPFQLLKQWVEDQDALMSKRMNQALRKAGFHQIADDAESDRLFLRDDCETSKEKEDGQEDCNFSDDSSQDSDDFCSKDYHSCKSSYSTDSDDDSVTMSKEETIPKELCQDTSVKQPAEVSVQMNSTEQQDSSTNAKSTEDDIAIFPTPDNIKKWEEAITANLDEPSAEVLKSSFRSNMLVMHLIKDEYHHEPLCMYMKDKNMSLNSTYTEYMSYVMAKLAAKNCEARGLSSKLDYGEVQSRLGKIVFHLNNTNSTTVSYDDLTKSLGDEIGYAMGWIEPVGCNPGEPGRCTPSEYRFKHESLRKYVMAVWLTQRLCTEGDRETANKLLVDCFFGSSGWDCVCYHVAGLMADSGEVALFDHHLSRVLWAHDGKLPFDIQQKCAICLMESKQGSEIQQFQHIFPEHKLDLTSWPNMSYIGKLAFTNLGLIVELPPEVKFVDVILNSKKFTTKKRTSLLTHLRSNPNLFWKLVHYLPFRDYAGQALCLTDGLHSVKTFHFDGFGFSDVDFGRVITALQFAPFLETINFRGNNISTSSIHTLCNAMVHTPNVKELMISHSNLTDESVQHLANSLKGFKHLKSLNLSHNAITSAGAKAIVQELPQLSRLDLSHNLIDDEMVTGVADIFASRPCMLSYIDVTCNNNITTSGYKMLLRALSQVEHGIEVHVGSSTLHYMYTLVVQGSKSEITIKVVDTDVLKAAHELFPHDVRSVQLSHNGKALYAVPVEEGKTISQIKTEAVLGSDASENMKAENMKALSAVIPIGQGVQQMAELLLGGHLLDDSVRLLPDIFHCIPHIKQFDLSINKITSDGISAVFKDFPLFKSLELIDLGYNQLTSKCLKSLVDAFLSLESLRDVKLNDIRCTSQSVDETLQDVKSFVLSLKGRVCKLEYEGDDLLYDGSSGEDNGSSDKGKRKDGWSKVADRLKGGEPVNIKVKNFCITLSLSVKEETVSEKRKIDYAEGNCKEKRQRKV